MKEILQSPNEILETPSTEASEEDSKNIALELLEVYKTLPPNRVGLAAPQIGINKNVAIVLGRPMMNLQFQPAQQTEIDTEGCFSVDHAKTFFKVERPKYGWAMWIDPFTAEKHEEKITGFFARVFQHELDHINGKLCNHESPQTTQI